ncbi:hypothetical protein D3C86_1398120 [compost metagenome]
MRMDLLVWTEVLLGDIREEPPAAMTAIGSAVLGQEKLPGLFLIRVGGKKTLDQVWTKFKILIK